MISKIISGGQIGADIAGLRAALKLGLNTGGWMPKGFRTKEGFHPEYAEIYGLQEHESSEYPPRTYLNVLNSDGTIRFADNFNSPGEKCTLRAINAYKKPKFDVDMADFNSYYLHGPKLFDAWITEHKIEVLNVAGNAIPGAFERLVERYLVEAISGTYSES